MAMEGEKVEGARFTKYKTSKRTLLVYVSVAESCRADFYKCLVALFSGELEAAQTRAN